MARARLIFHAKRIHEDGAISEVTLWEVPAPVVGSRHSLKYSLYYGRNGIRPVAYDNERGTGDHRHLGDVQTAYVFTSVEELTGDLENDAATACQSAGKGEDDGSG